MVLPPLVSVVDENVTLPLAGAVLLPDCVEPLIVHVKSTG
jgi:hypothetical protein